MKRNQSMNSSKEWFLKNGQYVIYYLAAFLFVLTILALSGCRKKELDLGRMLTKETGNPRFKEMDEVILSTHIRKKLEGGKSWKHPRFMKATYASGGYRPLLLGQFLKNEDLREAVALVGQAEQHGLDPEMFAWREATEQLDLLYDVSKVKTLSQAYERVAEAELLIAHTLTTYQLALQFGVINPKRVYAHYYMDTQRPDSLDFRKIYETRSVHRYLDSIAPRDRMYLKVQEMLAKGIALQGYDQEESRRMFIVHLERMRWRNQPKEASFVWVNIPEMMLDVMVHGKSLVRMKVAVGEGRSLKKTDKLRFYDEDDLRKDRPFSRETPQLNSRIESVQVNPVWNIPQSIAGNEIVKLAAQDRYYLSNKGIEVYEKGKLIEDPETIDWANLASVKDFHFKQKPGDANALGKIKFLFPNQSSVYLHDTPEKGVFQKEGRAVSHGCVRVENPLELARALFGPGEKLKEIQTEMNSKKAQAKDLRLPKPYPVYLVYLTCAMDAQGNVRGHRDVYGLDVVLYSHLQQLKKKA